MLWQFKWMINSLTRFPEVPLDRTYAVLEDMERRYRDGGHSLHAVHGYREKVARHLGDHEAAATWYARWHAAARDALSDCAGCDPTAKVAHLAWEGRDEEAVAVAAPVLEQKVTCQEQPQAILSELLPVYLRTGRHEEARDAHRRAYRLLRTELADLEDIGTHVEFCALSGNEPRGLEIVERHLDWLDRAPNPYAGMRFAAAAALLLRRLDELGLSDVTVAGRPAAEIRAELTAYATGLAERFDARNGTTHQSDQVRAMLSAAPVVDHLPLTPHARRPVVAPVPVPAPAPLATDPDELLAAAEEHWERQEAAPALAAWARFDELAGEVTPLQAARRSDGAGLERLLAGDPDGAIATWQDTVDRYAAAGDEERRQMVLGRIGALLVRRGDESGVAMVEDSAAYLDGRATVPRHRTAALLRLAAVRTDLGRPSDALTVLSQVEPGPDVESERARAYVELGDRDKAVEATRLTCDGYRASGRRGLLADASLRLGELLAGDPSSDDAAAGEAYTEAITSCPADQEFLRLAAHACRGNWLFSRDKPAEAVEDLVEAVAGFTALGAQPQAAYARRDLSRAYYEAGRYLEAAEAAEEAAPLFERLGDPDAANDCRFMLAHAQRQLGETEPSAATFTALADVRAEEFPGQAAELLENAGELLSGVDKDVLAAERYAAAADLHRRAGDALSAASADRRHAMCLFYAGNPDAALAIFARIRASDVSAVGSAQATWERAVLCFDEARVLAATDRFEEALTRAESARDLFSGLEAADAVTSVERLLADIRQAASS